MNDIRWKQRFANYTKSLQLMERILENPNLNEAEGMGLIQCHQLTFELGWKVLKDILELSGFTVSSPRDVLKTAFAEQLIKDGHMWIEALENRNMLAHVYDQELADVAINKIRNQYYTILKQLYDYLEHKLNNGQ